jgi:hypothetical protein
MSKNRYSWDEKKIQKYIKAGRGKGFGKDYSPWLEIHDVPSQGRSSRIQGWKTDRLHHFLSDHEKRYFYLLEWADSVVDIREQFPLLEREMVQQIADNAGIEHPKDRQTGTPLVITTDFVISVRSGNKIIDIARTIKPSKELDEKRTIEKFEIERRYWTAKGVDWGIVTEKEIPIDLAANIESIHKSYWLEDDNEIHQNQLTYIVGRLKTLIHQSDAPLTEITTSLDYELNLSPGVSLKAFKYLLSRKEVIIDMAKPLNFFESVKSLNITFPSINYMEKIG